MEVPFTKKKIRDYEDDSGHGSSTPASPNYLQFEVSALKDVEGPKTLHYATSNINKKNETKLKLCFKKIRRGSKNGKPDENNFVIFSKEKSVNSSCNNGNYNSTNNSTNNSCNNKNAEYDENEKLSFVKKRRKEKDVPSNVEHSKKQKSKEDWKKGKLIDIWNPEVRNHKDRVTVEGSFNPMISPPFANRYFVFCRSLEKYGFVFHIARDRNFIKIVASKKDIRNVFKDKRLVYSLRIYRRRVKTDESGGISFKSVDLFSRQEIDVNEIVILDESIHKNAMCGYKITVVKHVTVEQQQQQQQHPADHQQQH
jgi:hypothetical protein